MHKFDHNIGFWEKRQFFRRKLAKIAENCDHNIGPRLRDYTSTRARFQSQLKRKAETTALTETQMSKIFSSTLSTNRQIEGLSPETCKGMEVSMPYPGFAKGSTVASCLWHVTHFTALLWSNFRRYHLPARFPNVVSSRGNQGCQMVCFQTKNSVLGKFWRAL
jgi:hypothetical protein